MDRAGPLVVVCLLLFWLARALVLDRRARARPLGADPAALALERDPSRMSARELRVLPGVGPRRALAIAAHRRDHTCSPDGLAWSDVPGVGPVTEARVRAWLVARSMPVGLCTRTGARSPPRCVQKR